MKPWVVILLVIASLAGCAYFNALMNKSEQTMARQIREYCSAPYYRRAALHKLVNGLLEPQGISMTVRCPGDLEARERATAPTP